MLYASLQGSYESWLLITSGDQRRSKRTLATPWVIAGNIARKQRRDAEERPCSTGRSNNAASHCILQSTAWSY